MMTSVNKLIYLKHDKFSGWDVLPALSIQRKCHKELKPIYSRVIDMDISKCINELRLITIWCKTLKIV